jgi:uridine monophosphate synthetase
MTLDTKSLILDLYAIHAFQFNSFTLKSGIQSPIYIDLRLIISYPHLLKKMSAALHTLVSPLSFNHLCGVPYAAIPIATALALAGDYPMVFCRKEAKDYGMKKLVEGKFEKGQTCLLVEDVITSGASILETVHSLRSEGLIVNDVVVMLDREQGGKENLKKQGIALHALLNIFTVLQVLLEEKKITQEAVDNVTTFLKT